jgi:hypothetical protein
MRTAYYFEFGYKPGMDPGGYADEAVEFVKDWQDNPEKGTLKSILPDQNRMFLVDTRSCAKRPYFVLTGTDRKVYAHCDRYRTCGSVTRYLNANLPKSLSENKVRHYLDTLVANRLMVTDGKYYLSLALKSGAEPS